MIRPLSRRREADAPDRGSGSVEFAGLSVVFLMLVFLVVQAALYYHARNVVKAEAEGVARAVRAYPQTATGPLADKIPTQEQMQSLATTKALDQWELLDESGNTTSRPVVVARPVGYDQVLVTVSADPIMLIPGLFGGNRLTITQTAGGPFEIFKRSGDD